jgi:hypothetical protein
MGVQVASEFDGIVEQVGRGLEKVAWEAHRSHPIRAFKTGVGHLHSL